MLLLQVQLVARPAPVVGGRTKVASSVGARTVPQQQQNEAGSSAGGRTNVDWKKDQSSKFAWKCDLCEFHVSALTWKKCSKARTNHISYCHPGVPRNRFSSFKKPRTVFVTDCPWPNRKWTCAKCLQGIDAQATRGSILEVAKEDLDTCSQISVRENRKRLTKIGRSQMKLGLIDHYMRKKRRTLFAVVKEQLCKKTGHDLMEVPVPFENGGTAGITCCTCTGLFRCMKAITKKCRGIGKRADNLCRKAPWWAWARCSRNASLGPKPGGLLSRKPAPGTGVPRSAARVLGKGLSH